MIFRPMILKSSKLKLAILRLKDRIPYVSKYGEYFYIWRDDQHPRGSGDARP